MKNYSLIILPIIAVLMIANSMIQPAVVASIIDSILEHGVHCPIEGGK